MNLFSIWSQQNLFALLFLQQDFYFCFYSFLGALSPFRHTLISHLLRAKCTYSCLFRHQDDMHIRVFNYNTLERVHMFEAHSDYIRCIAVHPAQPYILTSSGRKELHAHTQAHSKSHISMKVLSSERLKQEHIHRQIVINCSDIFANNTFCLLTNKFNISSVCAHSKSI